MGNLFNPILLFTSGEQAVWLPGFCTEPAPAPIDHHVPVFISGEERPGINHEYEFANKNLKGSKAMRGFAKKTPAEGENDDDAVRQNSRERSSTKRRVRYVPLGPALFKF